MPAAKWKGDAHHGGVPVFLPIAYLVFWRLQTGAQRYVWLTVTGYAFCSFWDYRWPGRRLRCAR